MIRAGVLTLSDKGVIGKRKDLSGPLLREILLEHQIETAIHEIIADDYETIVSRLQGWSAQSNIDLIITTGGTGVSPRDVTPEATLKVITQRIPGMEEAMRSASLKKTPRAMLSRAICGIYLKTLIINLPGSPDAVRTGLGAIIEVIPHAIEKLNGSTKECA